jgi:hypothetical protein
MSFVDDRRPTHFLTEDNRVTKYPGIRQLVAVQVSPKRWAVGQVDFRGRVTLLDQFGSEVGLGERKPRQFERPWEADTYIRGEYERDMARLHSDAEMWDTFLAMNAEQEARRNEIIEVFGNQIANARREPNPELSPISAD